MAYLRRLWSYMSPYRKRLFLGVFLGILSAIFHVASFPTIRKVFEGLFQEEGMASPRRLVTDWLGTSAESFGWLLDMIPEGPFAALVMVVCLLVLLNIMQGLCKGFQAYLVRHASLQASVDISNKLYGNVLDLPVGFFTQARNSQVISRFTNDMNNIERGLDTIFGKLIREPLYFLGCLGYCAWVDIRLTLIAVCVLPIVGIALALLGKKAKRGSRKFLEGKARLLGILGETLAGIRIVKVFLGDRREKERFRQENRRIFRQTMKVVKAEVPTGPIVAFLGFIAGGLVIIFSGHYVITEGMKPSTVTAFYLVLSMAFGPVRKLANVNIRFQVCKSAAERVFEYMDAEAEKMDVPGSIEVPVLSRSIRFENVSFAYDESEPVLTDISFEVAQGETVAIVGVSGVGKTTLVNLLCRFHEPSAGRILFDDVDIAEGSIRSVRRQIGLVTQDVLLFDDTIRANIAYGRDDVDEEKVLSSAEAAHVQEFIERMPEGYDTIIGEGGALLSGGQKQRLAIARAIYEDPVILILDEATSSLDSESESLIKEALDKFMRGRTSFVVAHRLSTVEQADRIIVLERGRVQAIGTHEQLVESSDVYRGLYQKQFHDKSPTDRDA